MSITVEPGFFDMDLELDKDGKQTSISIPYFVFGATDEAAAIAAVHTEISPYYGEMVLRGVKLSSRLNETAFKVTADYQYDEKDLPESSNGKGYALSFEAGYINMKLYQAIDTTRYSTETGDATDYKGAIEYDGKEVKGVDIMIPIYTWSEKHVFSDAQMTSAFRKNFEDNVGKTNKNKFRGYEIGEVMFLGATGSRNGKRARWELDFKFSRSRNRTNIKVGPITVEKKGGWQYMWVKYAEKLEDGEVLKRPEAVYIETIFEEFDFAILGIGTSR